MGITSTSHLNFRGHARQALEFYQAVFGGQLMIVTYGQFGVPGTTRTEDRSPSARSPPAHPTPTASPSGSSRAALLGDPPPVPSALRNFAATPSWPARAARTCHTGR